MSKLLRHLAIVLIAVFAILWITQHRKPADRSKNPERVPSKAMQALDFWSVQRAYPQASIPDAAFYRAYEHSRLRIAKMGSFETEDVWESIGPKNQGGRTIALAVDPMNPDVIYAGSASGGLWRLTMNGSAYSWEHIDTGLPILGVNAIAVHPKNADIIYIGTGEVYAYQNSIGGLYDRTTRGSYGIGLLKTTDRGETWEKVIDWSYNQRRGVLALKIHPTDPDIIFAGTSEGTYRTTDGGDIWEKVHHVLMAVDLAVNPENPDILYVSCGNMGSPGSGIYRSMEGGSPGTWVQLAGGLPSSWTGKTLLCIFRASPNIIYADVADTFRTVGLFRSTDHGDQWEMRTNLNYADYQGWFAHYVRIDPMNENHIFCAGVHFYHSINGTYFNRQTHMHVDHHAYADHPTDPNIVYFGNDGGVYRTTDGGATYAPLNHGYVTTQFYNGFSSSSTNPDLAIGGLQDNSTVIYTGGDEWRLGMIGGDGAFTALNPQDNNILYGSYQELNIKRSTNGGDSWYLITNALPYGRSTCFIAPFVLSHSNPNILYGAKDVIFKTTNGGDVWQTMNGGQPLNDNPVVAMAVSPTDPLVLYAATIPTETRRAEVFKTTDGGLTWNNVTGSLPDRYYIDIQVSPRDVEEAYITLSGFGSSHVYRTLDGGVSWDDIGTGLPDVPTPALVIDPEILDHLYIGNDLGVYVSTNAGQTWTAFNENLPPAVLVMDLSISASNRKIRAVTHGNGVWERTLLSSTVVPPDEPNAPESLILYQNYPNPFNPDTNIPFDLSEPAFVRASLINVRGQTVRTLATARFPAGRNEIRWDGKDQAGRELAGGVYICELKTEHQIETKRMTLLR